MRTPTSASLGPNCATATARCSPRGGGFPTLATALFESTPLAWHCRDAAQPVGADAITWTTRPRTETQEVDWLVGAALLTRREVLTQVGGFDEGYFMYSEELDWQRRVKQAGWQVVYLPEAVITHYEGKSTEQVHGGPAHPLQPQQGALFPQASRPPCRRNLCGWPSWRCSP